MKQNIIVVDLDRCIGCMGCQVACKMENSVALGNSRIKIGTVGPTGTYPDLEMYFLPSMCQQCENPPCAEVCPTGATYKDRENGVIYIDAEKCIGCKSCNKACPYDANNFNEEMRIMDKCDQCVHLQGTGERPACVRNCAGRAMFYGDINDPDSDVSKVIKDAGSENVYMLKDSGNKPAVRYILRHSTWQDILPQECSERKRGRQ